MANKRMINGDTWEDEFFTSVSLFDRLLWIGCITKLADDQGRFRDDSDLIVLCATCHSKFHDVEIQEDDDDVQDSGIKF